MAKIIDNYILLETIGHGSFGEVHKGRNLISKEAVAVKTIKLDRFLNDTHLRDMIINEIQALKKLEDQSIVRMIKMLKSANNIYLVYEYLNGGSLLKLIEERGKIPEKESICILFGVLKGFKTLQQEKIIHRNINTRNLFFNDGIIKIKNFFRCKSPNSQKNFDVDNPLFASPEVLLTRNNQNDLKADIFSLGLVFYKLLFGNLPYPEQYTQEDLVHFYQNTRQEGFKVPSQEEQQINGTIISGFCTNLLEAMLVFDPITRIDWDILFQQPDVASIENQDPPQNIQTSSSHHQSNFDTIGQNFYTSHQSTNLQMNKTQPLLDSVQQPNNNLSQQEILKRRTTISLADKSNQNVNLQSTDNFNIGKLTGSSNYHGKENTNIDELDKVQKFNNTDQLFSKTIDKEQTISQPSSLKQISTHIIENRNNFQQILSKVTKFFELESWNQKIKPDIFLILTLKKAIKKCQETIDYCECPDENPEYDKKWQLSKQKRDIVSILRKDMEELVRHFWRLQQTIGTENQQIEDLQTLEIIDEEYVDNVISALN